MTKVCLSPEEIPRLHTGLIRDPIYHYITYSRNRVDLLGEKALLQNRWVKRLGRLYQNQGTFAAYPGAVHTRLQHSLGVMHLAGRFVEECYPRFYKTRKAKFGRAALKEREYVIQATRIAALLHDICHGPFSHLFDREVLRDHKLNHEELSTKLIKGELKTLIEGIRISWEGKELKRKIKAKDVDDILHPYIDNDRNKGFRDDLEFWKRPVSQIFHGVYSADNLDYLLRDAHYAGTPEYGTVDAERLIRLSAFYDTGVAIEEKSLSALHSFILSRMFMYQNVYYHRDVRAFEITVGEAIKEIADILGLFPKKGKFDWDVFYTLDDQFILSLGYHWKDIPPSDPLADRKRKIGDKILALTSTDGPPPLVQAYARTHRINRYPAAPIIKKLYTDPRMIEKLVKGEMQEKGLSKISGELRFDYRNNYVLRGDPAQAEDWIGVYNEEGHLDSKSVSEVLEGVPIEVVGVGVYCPPKYVEDVKAACRALWEGNENTKPDRGETST